MKYELSDDKYCFVCGELNPEGLHVDFYLKDDKAIGEFLPLKKHQGYKDIVHGGIISTLLDEAMVKIAILKGIICVTAEITVRFKSPLKINEKIIIEASIDKIEKRLIYASAIAKKEDGLIIAEAHGKLIKNLSHGVRS